MYFEHYEKCFKTTQMKIKFSCWAVSTQIEIIIYRYLRKLRNKSSIKHLHIDKNITVNIEAFPLGFIAVLSGRRHFSDLV